MLLISREFEYVAYPSSLCLICYCPLLLFFSPYSIIFCSPFLPLLQIAGSFPDSMTRCVQVLQETCELDFIDINVGCPIDLIYKKVCDIDVLIQCAGEKSYHKYFDHINLNPVDPVLMICHAACYICIGR